MDTYDKLDMRDKFEIAIMVACILVLATAFGGGLYIGLT